MSFMSETVLSQIENSILSLTLEEQRQLFAKLSDKLRLDSSNADFERELANMAQDEDIKRELKEIDADFRRTEFDGLAE